MNSQTSLVAQQTRLNEWAQQIQDCQNRPEGMKVDEWCQLNGIKKASYYWRLRKVREAFLETSGMPAFVELPAPSMDGSIACCTDAHTVVAILKGKRNVTVELTDQASPSIIKLLLGELDHAE